MRVTVLVALAASIAPAPAFATDVFTLEGLGAKSRGMGGAGASLNIGLAGIMSNPATLSLPSDDEDDTKNQILIGLDIIGPSIEARNLATGEIARSTNRAKNRGPYFAPQLAYAHKFDNVTVSIGAFAAAGLGAEYGKSSFLSRGLSGQQSGLDNSARLFAFDMPLAVSARVSDKLTVGGSVDAMWIGLSLDLQLQGDQVGSLIRSGRASGSLVPVLGGIPGLDAAHIGASKNSIVLNQLNGWGVGGRLGFTYQMLPATTIGGSYNFKTNVADLKGSATLTAISTVAGQIPLGGYLRVRDFQLPARVSVGITQSLGHELTLTAEYQRVMWKSAVRNINVSYTADAGGGLDISLPQNYRNQNIVLIGGQYRLQNWALRAGGRFASEAVPNTTLLALVPGIPRYHATLGASYRVSRHGSIDFAFSHAFKERSNNVELPNTSAPISVTHSQNNGVVSYTLGF